MLKVAWNAIAMLYCDKHNKGLNDGEGSKS